MTLKNTEIKNRYLFVEVDKQQKGITLISLVITIIILLILAGISIVALFGENGIMNRANDAKEQNEIALEKEVIEVSVLDCIFDDKYADLDNLSEQEQIDLLNRHLPEGYEAIGIADDGSGRIVVQVIATGRTYLVDLKSQLVEHNKAEIGYRPGESLQGEGYEGNPYQITYIEDLLCLSEKLETVGRYRAGYVQLQRDLDFNDIDSYYTNDVSEMNEIKEAFKCIGKEIGEEDAEIISQCIAVVEGRSDESLEDIFERFPVYFEGTFDGDSKTISNFSSEFSLFTLLAPGTVIKNLTIKDSNIGGENSLANGGIAMAAFKATISNCIVTGDTNIRGTMFVGGIIGAGGNTKVDNCYNSAKVFGLLDIGGIVGAGYYMQIQRCVNTAEIQGTSNVGGIVGLSSNGEIYDTYNTEEIIGGTNTGGIMGVSGASGVSGQKDIIYNCYNIGLIQSTSSSKGAIIGSIRYDAEVSNTYYLSGTAPTATGSGTITGAQPEEKLETEMKNNSSFLSSLNSGRSVWKIVTSKNNGYPILSWQ